MRRADKVTASVSCASQADESLNYDKSIVTDFRDDRDHGGTILYGKYFDRPARGPRLVCPEFIPAERNAMNLYSRTKLPSRHQEISNGKSACGS